MVQLKWLWSVLKGHKVLFCTGVFLSAVTSVMLVINPRLSQTLIDEVIVGGKVDILLPILGVMMAVQLIRLGLRYLMVILLEISSQDMVKKVRERLYDIFVWQDRSFFDRISTGDLMTRLTGDLEMCRHTAAWISYNVTDSVVTFAAAIIMMLAVDPLFTLALVAITPIIAALTIRFSKKINPEYSRLREKLSGLSTVAQENIAGNRVVKAFTREAYEMDKFSVHNTAYRDAALDATRTLYTFQPIIEGVANSLTIITVLVGGLLVIGGHLTYGELMLFSSLTWALSNPLRNLGMELNDLQRFFASSSKVMEVYYSKPMICDAEHPVVKEGRFEGALSFEQVDFRLSGEEILKDVSFSVRPGETLGIVGATGSGKSTIVNLISRFYDVSGGRVLLDGVDIRYYSLSSLRSALGIATQDVFLFSDTVENNIRFSDPAMTREQVEHYARCADADGFIRSLEDGYDTVIGERGAGLSGGQRQRIALARALAARPALLILDDTTSAVDMKTEQYIQKQLSGLDFPCTKIIIAQRVSSVMNADRILVLDRGRVAESGTHEELVKQGGYYASVYAMQSGQDAGGEPVA